MGDDTSTIGFDTFTIEVFNSVVMAVLQSQDTSKSLGMLRGPSSSEPRDHM